MIKVAKEILFQYFSVPAKYVSCSQVKSSFLHPSYYVKVLDREYILLNLKDSVFFDIHLSIDLYQKVYNFINDPELYLYKIVKNKLGFPITTYLNSHWQLIEFSAQNIPLKKFPVTSESEQIGKALGKFHKNTNNFPVIEFDKKLPNPYYLEHCIGEFTFALQITEEANLQEAHAEISYLQDRIEELQFAEEFAKNNFSKKIIHGNPISSNFLFNTENPDCVALINWDQICIGYTLFDYAQMMRTVSAIKPNDFDSIETEAFSTKNGIAAQSAYLLEMQDVLTPIELEHLDVYYKIIVLAEAMRYITAFLLGNKNIKTTYFTQNLKKASNQILLHKKLSREIYS